MQITFRPASPDDVEYAVPLIYASGPDAFDYIFDDGSTGTAREFLAFAYAKKGGEFGFANHLVAEADGRVCGIGACFSGRRSFRFALHIAWTIIQFYGLLRGIGVIVRGLQFERIVRPPMRSEYAVVHIAVEEQLRGKGLGSRLIHQLIIISRALPPCTYVLDVSEINPRAMALYERLGFKRGTFTPSGLKREISSGRLIEVPGHYRMTMDIRKDK